MVSDDENNQAVTNDAFEVLHFIAAKRLALGRLTVIDATNVQPEARKPLVELARQYHCLPVAIVLNLPERLCQERNRLARRPQLRPPRHPPAALAAAPVAPWPRAGRLPPCLRAGEPRRGRSGHGRAGAAVERQAARTWPVRHHRRRSRLLRRAGSPAPAARLRGDAAPEGRSLVWGNRSTPIPQGRKAVFVGDLVDRGPRILDTVRLVRNMVGAGSALCVPGNHDMKLMRKLRGKDVQITHGLANTPCRNRRPARRSS